MKHILGATLLSALAVCGSAQAATNLITFEEPVLTAMANSVGALVPGPAQLSTQFLGTFGVSFSSAGGFAAVVDHGFPALTPSGTNIFGGTTADGRLGYTSTISAAFFDPFNSATKATTTRVRVLGDLYGIGSGTITLTAYDQFGAVLAQSTDTDDKPFGQGPVVEVNAAGIHSITLVGTSGTVGFDNFEFESVTPISGGVPEPATWAMMLLGFGALGAEMRRRRPLAATRRVGV